MNLNAWNGQDERKFKGLADTGSVHAQCPHVLIMSAVDLQFGER